MEANNKDNGVSFAESRLSMTEGKAKGLALELAADFSDFDGNAYGYVEVDGKRLARDRDYTASAGSVVIKFKSEYVNSLSAGEHSIKVATTAGYGEVGLTVNKASDVQSGPTQKADATTNKSNANGTSSLPKTGDAAQGTVAGLVAVAATALAGAGCWLRRKRI